ncbi:restriction endonuclease subunit S [Corynebacterium glyciniphilum]|uniref:restriction endonuclease subunit S n=1 Tax=Corynebacterium glyciniphilum TaxID=1404244 RepID=UPI003FD60389
MNRHPLEDLLEEIIDHRGKTPKKLGGDFSESGVPVASAQLVKDGILDLSDCRYVPEEIAARWMPIPVKKGDVLLTSEAPLGRVAWIKSNDPLVLGQRLFGLRSDPSVLNGGYLGYWLSSKAGRASLLSHQTGSTVSGIRQSALRKVEIPLPDISIQEGIARILGALDDKIAVNSSIASSGLTLIDSVYQATRKSRSATTFADVTSVGGGATPSTKTPEYWGDDHNWATPSDITALDGPWLSSTSRSITDAGLHKISSPLYPAGSILMTSRASIGHYALAAEPTAVNQGFIVLNATERKFQPWIFTQLRHRTNEFIAWANGATFLELSKSVFKKLPVDLPEGPVEDFSSRAEPILARIRTAQKESRTLAATRDELLPLLMSGKITVRDAEKRVEKEV